MYLHTTSPAASYIYNTSTIRVCKRSCKMEWVISGLFLLQSCHKAEMGPSLWVCCFPHWSWWSLSASKESMGWAVHFVIENIPSAQFYTYPKPRCSSTPSRDISTSSPQQCWYAWLTGRGLILQLKTWASGGRRGLPQGQRTPEWF